MRTGTRFSILELLYSISQLPPESIYKRDVGWGCIRVPEYEVEYGAPLTWRKQRSDEEKWGVPRDQGEALAGKVGMRGYRVRQSFQVG